ncbi:hypothetical protein [Pseudoalteromonas umbrosa]|uniref:hypothetical protein n=1 Tax=Pseudoalteromonas umbrosa TaxID=3048489 RepID=UPI0024C22927|nr:hypothetical protein [Pseudoalteromonas sp. B95]MDK1290239.1 hypothetical protein [Pseudoalteromonas sp. B95]
MSVINKLRDLFVIRKGGGKTQLEAGKRYALTRSGALKTIPNNNTTEFNNYVDDKDALVLLGDRGDLRQLETITRNLSVLFNNTVDQNEMYTVTPVATSSQVTAGAVYSVGGLAYCSQVKLIGSPEQSVSFTLYGSNDNVDFELIGETISHTFTSDRPETIDVDRSAPKYRYFKIEQGPLTPPPEPVEGEPLGSGVNEAPIIGVIFILQDISVSKFFEKDKAGNLASLVSKEYDLSLYAEGKLDSDQYLYVFAVPKQLKIRNNFDGFLFNTRIPPSADCILSIKHNDTEIGTATLQPNGSVVLSPIEETFIEAGDWLSLQAPTTPDVALEDISVTLSFERTDTV